ncbi:MAG: phosphate-Binding protein [Gammaproteobacteria bacterium]|nr:phosphate-Binding protein [Gammaproteobacteria bacterium]
MLALAAGLPRARSAVVVALLWLNVAVAQPSPELPEYRPSTALHGTLRNYGGDFGGLLKRWEEGFQRYQPGIQFSDKLPGSDVATSGLVAGVADIGTSGREPMLIELEAFHDAAGSDLVLVPVATGTLDVKGTTWTPVVLVPTGNPIKGLSLRQLDGIFGAERTGGYRGYRWSPEGARSAREDIRTWGQLGLRGKWTHMPIHTYGYAVTGMSNFFQQTAMSGGTKWNPNYREYVESGSKMIAATPGGEALGIEHMLEEVSSDTVAIAWTGLRQASSFPGLRPLPLSREDGGPYVAPTRENLQNRSYPLARFIYMFIRRDPGAAVEPLTKEFLSYVLSRQGQQDVAAGNVYLPLTPDLALDQVKKLN